MRENFEVENAAGAFDDGLRRRFWIAPAGPNRIKASSIESPTAKVDGVDGVIQVTRENDEIEIHVRSQHNPWTRGMHSVELHYIAKHQFNVYDDHEEMIRNVSGKWDVPIEKAEAELVVLPPGGWPPLADATASTGTDSNFKFDCLHTELATGTKFETTHPIEPGKSLFIDAMFSKRGYLVSNVKEDGWRAIIENHPRQKPWAYFFAILIVVALLGFGLLKLSEVGRVRPSPHSVAILFSIIATIFSGVSMFVFNEPYSGMPGAGLGLITAFFLSRALAVAGLAISLIVGVGTNLVFYYFVAMGIRHLWLRFSDRGATATGAR